MLHQTLAADSNEQNGKGRRGGAEVAGGGGGLSSMRVPATEADLFVPRPLLTQVVHA